VFGPAHNPPWATRSGPGAARAAYDPRHAAHRALGSPGHLDLGAGPQDLPTQTPVTGGRHRHHAHHAHAQVAAVGSAPTAMPTPPSGAQHAPTSTPTPAEQWRWWRGGGGGGGAAVEAAVAAAVVAGGGGGRSFEQPARTPAGWRRWRRRRPAHVVPLPPSSPSPSLSARPPQRSLPRCLPHRRAGG
jgi:hypothetical protein